MELDCVMCTPKHGMAPTGSVRTVLALLTAALGVALVLALAAAFAARGWIERRLTSALLHELSARTQQSCTAEAIALALDGRISMRQLRCGDVVAIDTADAGIDWRRTVLAVEPQFWVRAAGIFVDLTALPPQDVAHVSPAEDRTIAVPAPLRSIRIAVECHAAQLRFGYGHDAVDLSLGAIELEARLGLGDPVTMHGDVTGQQVLWQRGSHDVGIDAVRAELQWTEGRALYLLQARVRGPSADLWFGTRGAGRVRVQGMLAPEALAAFVEEIPLIGGQLRVVGSLIGSLTDPEVDLLLRLEDGVWNRLTHARLRARFVRRGTVLTFSSVRLHHAAGLVAGEVEFDLDEPVRLRIDGSMAVRRPAEVLRMLGLERPPPQLSRVVGDFRLGGVLDPLALEWTASGQGAVQLSADAGVAALPVDWSASGKFRERHGEVVGSARWRQNLEARVEHRWSETGFAGVTEVELRDLHALGPHLGEVAQRLGLSGAVGAVAEWGDAVGREMRVSASAREITVLGDALREFECTASLRAGAEWEVGPCRARDRTGGAIGISGTWNLEDDNRRAWKVHAEQVSAEVLSGVAAAATGVMLPISRGRVSGSAEIHGWAAARRIAAAVEVQQFRLYREPISWLKLELTDERGRWQLTSELARRDGVERLALRARGEGGKIEEAVVSGDPIALSSIVGLGQRGARGSVQVSGHWSGPLLSPLGELRVTGRELRFGDWAVGDAELRIDFQPDAWRGRLEGFGGRLQGAGQLRPQGPYPFDVSVSLAALTIESGNGQRFQLDVTARTEASGRLLPPRVQRAELWLQQLVVARDPYRLEAASPVHVSFDGTRLQLEPFEFVSGGSRIRVGGGGRVPGKMEFQVDGSLDLELLELLGPPLADVDGVASVGARIWREESGRWHGEGSVAWSDGMLEIEGLPPLSGLTFTGRLVNEELRDAVLAAEVGGGRIDLAGAVHALHGPALEWRLQQVSAVWADDLEARLSGKGSISGAWDKVVVAGDIEVENAVYDRNLGLADLLRWLQERLFAPRRVQQVMRAPVAVDLKIHSPGNVYVDNNIAKVEFWLDLWVRGNLAEPHVGGRIGVLDGEVTAQGRTFTVTGGTIEFRDPASRNPWLHLTAETRIRSPYGEYQIGALVTGQADRPRVQFSADDPSLTPDDIVSLIAVGRPRRAGWEGTFSPAEAALALLPKREAEQQIQRWLGVDRFEVSATQARDTGAVEPRFTIGKELSERLYASVWTSVGVQSRQAVQLEYRWTRRISLLGTWESGTAEAAGAFGGDVKFRMEFLRSPFSLLSP